MKPTFGCVAVIVLGITGALSATPAVRSDAEITRVFREKLAKSKLAREGIQIRVERGIATITGKTEILQHKGAATKMARSSGAVEVENNMVVAEAARKAAGERLAAARQKAAAANRVRKPPTAPPPVRRSPTVATAAPSPPTPAQQVPPPVRRATIKHDSPSR